MEVHVFEETDSTNNVLKKMTGEPAEYIAAVTSKQTAGRGRKGHSFVSPKGGLYLSLLYHPKEDSDEAVYLSRTTLAAAVSTVEAIELTFGIRTEIKWVNDIYCNGKKAGGILCEAPRNIDGSLAGIIIGIGINCGSYDLPDELKDTACTLGIEDPDLETLTANILNRLVYWIHHLKDPVLLNKYRSKSFLLGKKVSFVQNGIRYEGVAEDINEDGNLVVAGSEDAGMVLNSGEVSLSSWSDVEDHENLGRRR